MLLFICHASEDQADFVRPLAEELRKEYEVWYSEYMLTLGDQLLAKIDQGLAACDYGVVVLSKPFFAKKWPRAELDGLFARETPSRKIILPIWKDITQEEVCGYSPILASRVAATNTAGIPKIVEEIRLAVIVLTASENSMFSTMPLSASTHSDKRSRRRTIMSACCDRSAVRSL